MAIAASLIPAGQRVGAFKTVGYDLTADQTLREPEGGFLYCNGAVAGQSSYPKLFAELGTRYNTGGEGAGNFRLPDFRDGSILASGDLAARPPGTRGGSVGHSHTAAHEHTQSHTHDMGSHTHTMFGHTHSIFSGYDQGSFSSVSDWVGSGTQREYVPTGHFHVTATSSGPSTDTTGGPSGSLSTSADGSSTSGAALAGGGTVNTDGQDPPHQVCGGVLVRYA